METVSEEVSGKLKRKVDQTIRRAGGAPLRSLITAPSGARSLGVRIAQRHTGVPRSRRWAASTGVTPRKTLEESPEQGAMAPSDRLSDAPTDSTRRIRGLRVVTVIVTDGKCVGGGRPKPDRPVFLLLGRSCPPRTACLACWARKGCASTNALARNKATRCSRDSRHGGREGRGRKPARRI